jgi:hypothetical protein
MRPEIKEMKSPHYYSALFSSLLFKNFYKVNLTIEKFIRSDNFPKKFSFDFLLFLELKISKGFVESEIEVMLLGSLLELL